MAAHFETMNGCYYTEPSIFPSNWNCGGKSTLKTFWRVQYYFYDPDHSKAHPYGKLCIIKGMNSFKNLRERRAATKLILNEEVSELNRGYNPISKEFMIDKSVQFTILHPHLKFIDAFRVALTKMTTSQAHCKEIEYAINRLEQVSIKLNMRNISIGDLKRRELKILLDHCELTPNYFNKFRAYLSTLFNELLEYECCDTNITRDIRRQKTVKSIREILTTEELRLTMNHLKFKNYSFYRYAQIFMFSGARSTELLSLTPELVDLDNQEFTVIIKKGKRYIETKKVILENVIDLWKEILELAEPNDFLFSKGLVPGTFKNKSKQITRRWERHVKNSRQIKNKNGETIQITADFYSLKHSLLDSQPTDIAKQMANHTNSKTTEIYQVNKQKRAREVLKRLKINLQ